VFHVRAVLLALARARCTCSRARLDDSANHSLIRLRLPREDPSGDPAQIGAVVVQSDALREHLGIRLGAARIGARDAGLGAIETRLHAREQRGGIEHGGVRVSLEHLSIVMKSRLRHLKPPEDVRGGMQ
jgi:hypothetical protein